MRVARSFLRSVIVVWGTSLLAASALAGAEHEALVGKPETIAIEPSAVKLIGSRSQQQLIVSSEYGNGELRDLTRVSQFVSEDPTIATVTPEGLVLPKANGTVKIVSHVGSMEASITVTVQGMDRPAAVQFENHVVAAISKSGCNAGACHGSPSGKNGFRLSLRGHDPALDLESLTRDVFGRRTNRTNPEESLMLRKPSGKVPHGGGIRLTTDSLRYQLLRDWIAEGLHGDPEGTERVERIEVVPERRVLTEPAESQQLVVLAHFSDGSTRDVTPLSVYSSSNEEVAKVTAGGLVEGARTGETAVLVRYLDQMKTAYVTFLRNEPDFVWTNPPENNYIDRLAFTKMKLLHIVPSELCSDEEFIRRASLDVRGTLPSVSEVQQFLADEDPAKRSRLIEGLLESPEYLDYWTLKLADVLRSNRKVIQAKGVYVFQRWIRASLAQDKPFDQFVRELLVAEGDAFRNPAANYYRVSRDPQSSVETTAQLFLGIRMQCAKCHNHPFERWSQDDYYGLAAFFARVKHKKGLEPGEELVYVGRSGEVTQPRSGRQMPPSFIGGQVATIASGQDRREVLAKWLTSPENPFFAKAAVNRIWYHVMGRGIIDPPDDIRDSNPPSNEELLEALAKDFVEHNFSIKHVVRTIMNSRVYQLSAETNKWNQDDEAYFSHCQAKMLTAEQLLDAICKATDLPEKFEGLPLGWRATQLPDPSIKHPFLQTFGQPNRELACECERESESSLSQALQMINGPLLAGKLREKSNRIGKLLAAKKSEAEFLEELYLATLSRLPRDGETSAIAEHLKSAPDRRKAWEDVHWALLNSKEFLFRH